MDLPACYIEKIELSAWMLRRNAYRSCAVQITQLVKWAIFDDEDVSRGDVDVPAKGWEQVLAERSSKPSAAQQEQHKTTDTHRDRNSAPQHVLPLTSMIPRPQLQQPPLPASRPAAAAKPKVETVEPLYKPDGTPCCPTHKRPLSDGQYGLYCSARAKPGEAANTKGYCALRFAA